MICNKADVSAVGVETSIPSSRCALATSHCRIATHSWRVGGNGSCKSQYWIPMPASHCSSAVAFSRRLGVEILKSSKIKMDFCLFS